MIRYIAVVHWHYDATEPVEGDGTRDRPAVSYATYDEAATVAAMQTTENETGYVWAVEV